MASTAGTIIDSVARRVRDTNNTAHSRAFVRDIIDRMQVILNAQQEYIFTETVLIATPNKALYSVENDIGSTITVSEVRINGRELDRQNWQNLHRISSTWLNDQADTPFAWAPIGRSLIAIYPAPSIPLELTFSGSKITTALNDDNIPLELRAEDEDIVKDLVNAILLVRQRDLDTVPGIIKRVQGKLGIQQREITEPQGME